MSDTPTIEMVASSVIAKLKADEVKAKAEAMAKFKSLWSAGITHTLAAGGGGAVAALLHHFGAL